MKVEYQRFLTPGINFDPLKLARETEKLVCKGDKRKYTEFYATGVYGGIATGYTVGCCLRCFYCWVDWSRDYPEKYGDFYSPQDAFENLKDVAVKFGFQKLRISGAEPTIGKKHLLALLEFVERSSFPLFILETNGILLGTDKEYVKEISRFKKVHVRVSLKAGKAEGFAERTGARKGFFNLPYQAIKNLLDYGTNFHVAAMTDARIMSAEERKELLRKLYTIKPKLVKNLEEEIVDPYSTTLTRLKYANVDLKWKR